MHCPNWQSLLFFTCSTKQDFYFYFFYQLPLPDSEDKSDETWVNVDDKTMTCVNLESTQWLLMNGQCHETIVRCLLRIRVRRLFLFSVYLELNLQGLDWHKRDYTKGHHREDKSVHHLPTVIQWRRFFKKPAFFPQMFIATLWVFVSF